MRAHRSAQARAQAPEATASTPDHYYVVAHRQPCLPIDQPPEGGLTHM